LPDHVPIAKKESMSPLEFLILLLVAGICGSIGDRWWDIPTAAAWRRSR